MKKCSYYINRFLKEIKNITKRMRCRDLHAPTIIASNCIGGMIYHDLGLKFNSPFINTYIEPYDFIKLCQDIPGYLKKELLEVCDMNLPYPVGSLGDIRIHFPHVRSFLEGKNAWDTRKKRVNYDDIRIITLDRCDGLFGSELYCLTRDMIDCFDKLPYEHKVLFSHIEYNEYRSVYYLPRFRADKVVGVLTDFYGMTGTRGYELNGFDTVKFIKGEYGC